MKSPRSKAVSQLEVERQRLEFEKQQSIEKLRLEHFKIKWISGVVAVIVALMSASSGITIAVIQNNSDLARIALEKQKDDSDHRIKTTEQERLFLETFSTQVMNGDLNYRRDFAVYVKTITNSPEIKRAWGEYHGIIEKELVEAEKKRTAASDELAKLQHQSDADAKKILTLEGQIRRLTRELEGGKDIRTRQPEQIDPDYLQGYLRFMAKQELKYFKPEEFLIAGAANSNPDHPAFGLNRPPPPEIWPNIAKIAKVMELFRERHGAPVRIISAYRSREYSVAIGSPTASTHVTGLAVDFTSTKGTPTEWADILRTMRDEGAFKGGIGVTPPFVHVDARGTNKDWSSVFATPRQEQSP